MNDKNSNVWAYIAGFIDGEGTISIRSAQAYKRKSGEIKRKLRPYVVITNTNLEAINWIRNQLNEVDIKAGLSTRQPKRGKTVYMLYIQKFSRIIKLLNFIEPFLIIKKANARNIRSFIELRKVKIAKERNAPFGDEEKQLANVIRLDRFKIA